MTLMRIHFLPRRSFILNIVAVAEATDNTHIVHTFSESLMHRILRIGTATERSAHVP